MAKPISASRELQAQWREKLPQTQRIMDIASEDLDPPRGARKFENLPPGWAEFVSSMQREVQQEVEAQERDPSDNDTDEERRGHRWSLKLDEVSRALKHLTRTILDDIGFGEGETIASLALLDMAFEAVLVELRDGGTGEAKLSDTYRIQRAVLALSSRHDDVQLRRVRALDTAENCARSTSIPDAAELNRLVEAMGEFEELTEETRARHKTWFSVDRPAMDGVLARHFLARIDERFKDLDPLVVLEEFAEARAEKPGLKLESEGRTGAARALARLCLQCGALDFNQHEREDFDSAVDRVRNVLLAARSRLKKEVQGLQRAAGVKVDGSGDR